MEAGFGNRGDHVVTLLASDLDSAGNAKSTPATVDFVITVTSANEPPKLTPIASRVVFPETPVVFDVTASDLDGETLHFDVDGLADLADVVSFPSENRLQISWSPTVADIGVHDVRVVVTDSGNGQPENVLADSMSFRLTVRETNQSPELHLPAVIEVAEGDFITISFSASDPDGDPLHWKANHLPLGASIEHATGTFQFSPTHGQAGEWSIPIVVSDGMSMTELPLSVRVLATNRAPRIASPGSQLGLEGQPIEFHLVGTDPDGDATTWATEGLPSGAEFDTADGRLRWTPTHEQAGSYEVVWTLSDSEGMSDSVTVPIVIEDVNRPPVVESTRHQVVIGGLLDFTISASDPDQGDTLSFAAHGLPAGATLDSSTGRIRWIPEPDQLGEAFVDVRVRDAVSEVATTIAIRSTAVPETPDVRIVATPSGAVVPGDAINVQVIADGYSDVDAIGLRLDGEPVTLDDQGVARLIATTPGRHELEATVTDVDGFTGSATWTWKVRDPEDVTAPEIRIASLLAEHRISAPREVRGAVQDSNLDSWRVTLHPVISTETVLAASGGIHANGIVLGEGTLTGDDIALGRIDPGEILPGFYELRLAAEDIAGRRSVTTVSVEVLSTDTPRRVWPDEVDRTFVAGDEEVTIGRRFDRLVPGGQGSFGGGWRMTLTDVALRTSVASSGAEEFGVFRPMDDGDRVHLTTPDGRRVGFEFAPIPIEQTGHGLDARFYRPAWVADSGVPHSLDSVDAVLVRGRSGYFELSTGRPYHPSDGSFGREAYRLTSLDGSVDVIDGRGTVIRRGFPSGIVLDLTESGVWFGGESVVRWSRDTAGRIVNLVSNDGGETEYRYDDHARLVEVIDRESESAVRYGYVGTERSRLAMVVRSDGSGDMLLDEATSESDRVSPLSGDLGHPPEFDGALIKAELVSGESHGYSFTIDESDLASTPGGSIVLRVGIEPSRSRLVPEMPRVAGLTPIMQSLDGDRREAHFLVDRPGLHLLSVRGSGTRDRGAYRLSLDVVGPGGIARETSTSEPEGYAAATMLGFAVDVAGELGHVASTPTSSFAIHARQTKRLMSHRHRRRLQRTRERLRRSRGQRLGFEIRDSILGARGGRRPATCGSSTGPRYLRNQVAADRRFDRRCSYPSGHRDSGSSSAGWN